MRIMRKEIAIILVLSLISIADFVAPVTVSSACTVECGTGLTAKYYDSMDFTYLKTARTDTTVNFCWGDAIPSGTGITNKDTFSVRWTGLVMPQYTEEYTFYTNVNDGVRLWLNDKLIIDQWGDRTSAQEFSGKLNLVAGAFYDIRMDYYENTGNASAVLSWSSASQSTQVIPQDRLYTANPTACDTGADNLYLAFQEDFSSLGSWATPYYNVNAAVTSGICQLTRVNSVPQNSVWGKIERSQAGLIPIDLSKFPILRIKIPTGGVSANAKWKIGIYKTSTWEYFELQGITSATGVYDYNIPMMTGWNGNEKLQVVLAIEGAENEWIKIDYLQFGGYTQPSVTQESYKLFAKIDSTQQASPANTYGFTASGMKVYEDNRSESYTWATFNWTFSDGGTAAGSTVNHTFTGTQPFSATLTVTDSYNNKEFASTEVGNTKYMYADYFAGYRSRDDSGRSDLWWWDTTEAASWSSRPGDLYQDGSDTKKKTISFYNPLVGYYDQWNSTTIEYSILLSKMLGIDGFAFEYQDDDCVADSLMQKFVPYAQKYGFKMTAQWIPSSMYDTLKDEVTTRPQMVDKANELVKKVTENYILPTKATCNTSGTIGDERPLWFVFNWDRRDSAADNDLPYTQTYNFGYTGQEMQILRSAIQTATGNNPIFMAAAWSYWPEKWNSDGGEHFPRTDVFDGLYGWVKPDFEDMIYDPSSAYYQTHGYLGANIDKIGTIAQNLTYLDRESVEQDYQLSTGGFDVKGAVVFPGFDDAYNGAWGIGNRRYIPISDANGYCIDQTMARINTGSKPSIGLMATFADWAEGSTIEPTEELQYDIAKKAAKGISNWKGITTPTDTFLDSYLPFIVDVYNFRTKYDFYKKAGYNDSELKGFKEAIDEIITPLLSRDVTTAQVKKNAAQSIQSSLEAGLNKQCIVLEWVDQTQGAAYDANAVQMTEDSDAKGAFYFPDSVNELLKSGTYKGKVSFDYKDAGKSWLTAKVNNSSSFSLSTDQYCEILKVRNENTNNWKNAKADYVAASFDDQFMDRHDLLFDSQGGMSFINNFTHTADALSVAFWVKNDVLSGVNNYINIINTDTGDNIFALKADNSQTQGLLQGVLNLSGNINILESDSSVFGTGNWTHVAATWDGSTNNFILYVDGLAKKTGTYTSGTMQTNGNQLLVSGVKQGMEGAFDELRVYNRALSSSEVSTLYSNPDSAAVDGLEGCWQFEEGTGVNIADAGPDPKHPATLYNGGTWNTDVPFSTGNTHSVKFYSDTAGVQLKKVKVELETYVRTSISVPDYTECFMEDFNNANDLTDWIVLKEDQNDPAVGGELTIAASPYTGCMLKVDPNKIYTKMERKDTGYICVDLDKNPVLRLKIDELSDDAMVKVYMYNITDNWSSRMIKGLTDETGILDYDISSITGWTGPVKLQIIVIVDGGENEYAVFDYIKVGRKNTLPIAEYGFIEEFNTASDWNSYQTSLSGNGSNVTMTVTSSTWGKMERNNPDNLVSIDLDKHPILKTDITATNGTWKLYAMDSSNWTSYLLQDSTSLTGTFEYDIPFLTGMSGSKTLQIQYVIEGSGKSLTVNDLRFRRLEEAPDWYLGFREQFTNSSTAIWNVGPTSAPGTVTVENDTIMKLLTGTEQWAKLERPSPGKLITLDLDTYPVLRVKATEAVGPWKIIIYNARDCDDIRMIKPSTDEIGIMDFNVRDITGWTGDVTMQVMIIAADGTGNYVKIDDLQFRKADYSYTLPADVGFEENFNDLSVWDKTSSIELACHPAIEGQLREKITSGSYGMIERNLTSMKRYVCANLDRYPVLRINVPAISNPATTKWKVVAWKYVDGTGWTENVLRGATNDTGVFDMNIPNLTGWSGDANLNIQIWIEGGINDYIDLDQLQLRRSGNTLPQNVGFDEDFSDVSDWNALRGTITSNGSTATITTGRPDQYNWGQVDRNEAGDEITVDLDMFKYLKINVASLDPYARWKLAAYRGGVEKVIQDYTTQTGVLYYNMQSGSPSWSGSSRMILKFYVDSTDGQNPAQLKHATFDYLQFVKYDETEN